MRKNLLFIILILLVWTMFSCSGGSTSSDTKPPTVAITYPANNSQFVQGSVITITADANDNKGIKEVRFYIDGAFVALDEEEPYQYEWDTGSLRDTDHTIYAKAYDTSDNSGMSEVITVTIVTPVGNPPNPPSNPDPDDNATSVSINANLSWSCTDPDDDPLTYDVYFGTTSDPSLVVSAQGGTTYDIGTLNKETTYYWKITAKDNNYNSTTGDIWQFTTEGNRPPDPPYNPIPEDSSRYISINITLYWSCIDPDGDPLTFDVYFGTEPTLDNGELVSNDQIDNSYDLDELEYETTYYWKIVASDGEEETEGDVWEFTTEYEGGYGTVTDIDGNVYQTLVIGEQEWMVENLKVTHYNNGDLIPHLTDNGDWTNTNDGAYCVYNNTPSNADTYGNLYNWYAVDDPRGLAPEGWHVPSDEEIMELEMYLGMTYEEAHDDGYRGTNEGSKLAGHADLWNNGALENDPEFGSSGFDFLPGGYRYYYDCYSFYYLGYYGHFWSSTDYNTNIAWHRVLYYDSTDVLRSTSSKPAGFSVRCVRD